MSFPFICSAFRQESTGYFQTKPIAHSVKTLLKVMTDIFRLHFDTSFRSLFLIEFESSSHLRHHIERVKALENLWLKKINSNSSKHQ